MFLWLIFFKLQGRWCQTIFWHSYSKPCGRSTQPDFSICFPMGGKLQYLQNSSFFHFGEGWHLKGCGFCWGSKWVIDPRTNIPHLQAAITYLPTIDPNFQRDIQVVFTNWWTLFGGTLKNIPMRLCFCFVLLLLLSSLLVPEGSCGEYSWGVVRNRGIPNLLLLERRLYHTLVN